MRKLSITLGAVIPLFCLLFINGLFAAQVANNSEALQRITIAEVKALQSQGEAILFVDTRSGGQWNQAKDKIKGAIHLTQRSELESFKQSTSAEQAIVTYCT